jgi:GAF domain-containing protein
MSHNDEEHRAGGASLWRGLEEVQVTEELISRPSRSPDVRAEENAIAALTELQSEEPLVILQRLAEILLETCKAGSAGISMLRGEGADQQFAWPAVVGRLAGKIRSGISRWSSPCGVVLDQSRPILFRRPELHFPYVVLVDPPVFEVLFVPFYIHGEPKGTLAVGVHDSERKFDLEDLRLLTRLSEFAARAVQRLNDPSIAGSSRQSAPVEEKSDGTEKVH